MSYNFFGSRAEEISANWPKSFGFYGEGDIGTVCRAGGNGPDDYVCLQVTPTTIVIDAA